MRLYATFDGRARRSEYWYFYLFSFILSMVASFGAGAVGIPALSLVVSLALLIPHIAVAARRMHDVGKSGWFMLIPIYNLILALTPGEVGPNKYGQDPKGAAVNNNSDVLDDQIV